MPAKKKREPLPEKAREPKTVTKPIRVKTPMQQSTELEKVERTFAAFSKANELRNYSEVGKYLQSAFGAPNLTNGLAFLEPGWQNWPDA